MKKNNNIIILNSTDLSLCPEVVDIFNSVGSLINIGCDYDEVYNNISNCHAYMCGLGSRIDKNLILKSKCLKVIGTPSTGIDHIDMNALKEAGIECFSIAKDLDLIRSFTATSEHAFALALALNRKLINASKSALNGNWAREKFTGWQFNKKICGIVGLGRLGRISASIAKGFGMKVIAHDILDIKIEGVKNVDLETLFKMSDMISLHIHLKSKTKNIINRKLLRSMKPRSILINTSRGGLIDEDELLYVLKNNLIYGAALDIIDGEWDNNIKNHKLIQYANNHNNLLITPHIGGATIESISEARIFMAKKIINYLRTIN